MELGDKIHKSFKKGNLQTADTIVMAKILIHNMNDRYDNGSYGFGRSDRWNYVRPSDIGLQLSLHDPESLETELLIDLLFEVSDVILCKGIPNGNENQSLETQLTTYERKRIKIKKQFSYQSFYGERIIKIFENLMDDDRYEKYHPLIKKEIAQLREIVDDIPSFG